MLIEQLINQRQRDLHSKSLSLSVRVDGKGNNPFLCRGSESAVITSPGFDSPDP